MIALAVHVAMLALTRKGPMHKKRVRLCVRVCWRACLRVRVLMLAFRSPFVYLYLRL